MRQKIKFFYMNILFLSNNKLSATSGGVERTTFNLLTELSKDNSFSIFAIFLKIPQLIEGVVCIEDTIRNGRQINDYILKYKIDVVVFPGGPWYTNLLKNYNPNSKCKIITCLHSPPKAGEDYDIHLLNLEWSQKDIQSKLKDFLHYAYVYFKQPIKVLRARRRYHRAYNYSDAFVLLSPSYFKLFKRYAIIKNTDKLFATGNALSFEKSFHIKNYNDKKNEVLTVARFDEVSKRISFAIKSWDLIERKNWHFRIVGFGKAEKMYKSIVTDNKIANISFEGKQDLFNYYKDAKIFLMTSSFEG